VEALWKLSVTIAGIGAIGSFVLWSLYKEWLRLKIFPVLTKQHSFRLMQLFLVLTFLAFFCALVGYIILERGSHHDIEVSGYVIYNGKPITKDDEVHLTSQVDGERPSLLSLTEDGRFSGSVPADARRVTVWARVNGLTGSVSFDPAKNPHGNEIRTQSRNGAFMPIGESVKVIDAYMKGPIDRARVPGGEMLPYAACRPPLTKATAEDIGNLGPDACLFTADLESSVSWATVEDVVVKVNRFREPPKILSKVLVAPVLRAHLAYVQIDNPAKAGRSVFSGMMIHEKPIDYLSLKRGEPERLYVLVNALSPGVYDFDLGVVIRTRDGSETRWIADSTVYFYEKPAEKVLSGQEALRLLSHSETSFDADRWIDTVVQSKPAGAFDVIARILKEGRYSNLPTTEGAACMALGKLDPLRSFDMLTSLDLRGSGRPSCVAEGLMVSGTTKGVEWLIDHLKSTDPYVRSGAASAFKGKTPTIPKVRPILIGMLLNDSDRYSRFSAAEGLYGDTDKDSLDALRRALATEADDLVGSEVAQSLAAVDPDSVDLILKAMMKSDVFDSVYIDALIKLNDRKAACYFIELLRTHKSWPDLLVPALSKLTGEQFGYINVTTPDPTEDSLNERVVRRWLEWWDSTGAATFREGCPYSH
jgi:hypothetical protein